ncbi:hypothetical protein A2765_00945 [Candidatus Kaiserbacteria bacterium RIFCSPHIGHO2_01_FULL_56_24]|uniref:Glycoside hydrolase family 42 N-terminal domain-containing protein n=1 Tax=Candidatus Kaiserbacteria bacterium RIFCSPHIGHO2_01_FULL_56_24 TaxID=1798487 RepID=A0A1F6DFB3_9BACT|nr:MAG: hypothetical protein A2765_00945 [Candidatus Kaiserbacteria bacterium RIFCSPHIGHO2_01_FULL_56_24]
MRLLAKILIGIGIVLAVLYALSLRTIPDTITYGVSFSKLHSDELHLDWKEAYRAVLEDLGVKHLRLSAYWPTIEPDQGRFDFSVLDYQMQLAVSHKVDVILAVGRKTPGWPECHFPDWTQDLSKDDEHAARISYITAVVNRYKDSPALRYWQVENEPFLSFAIDRCGAPDEAFFSQEIDLVRSLDPQHPIITTDGGEFGTWHKARKYGDVFGSTMYLYVWSRHIGYWRYPISAGFFRLKQNVVDALFGKKPSILIELGLEPWLNQPIADTPIDEQLGHMSPERFEELIALASRTGFSEQYLWGAEWWYYMKAKGHPEFWERAKRLFK